MFWYLAVCTVVWLAGSSHWWGPIGLIGLFFAPLVHKDMKEKNAN